MNVMPESFPPVSALRVPVEEVTSGSAVLGAAAAGSAGFTGAGAASFFSSAGPGTGTGAACRDVAQETRIPARRKARRHARTDFLFMFFPRRERIAQFVRGLNWAPESLAKLPRPSIIQPGR